MGAAGLDYEQERQSVRARCSRLALWPPLSAAHRARMIALELRADRLSPVGQYSDTAIMAAAHKELDDITEETQSIAAQYDCTAISLETFAAQDRGPSTAPARIALALTTQEADLIVHALQNALVAGSDEDACVRDLAHRIGTYTGQRS
ncbi:hypothetical protein D2E71_24825 [Mycobacteroides abscessus]|uniref:hypothetical protein n=1 Tax=Mycobacteroides abscessus TaxID=36809 RepID=UPI000C26716A|nr:hypothetical protein [Mycobacteroides abscessus]RIS37861.1 hypothetical protein D2E71_24825 [Mycobacteroides abscessus]